MTRRERELAGKPHVFDVRNKGLFGVRVKAGPEVSEIRWDNGADEFVTNRYLRPQVDETCCTFPTCKCVTSTSTTQPLPDCPNKLKYVGYEKMLRALNRGEEMPS